LGDEMVVFGSGIVEENLVSVEGGPTNQVNQIFLELDSNLLNSHSSDEPTISKYIVKSTYNILNEGVLGKDEVLYKTFWKIKAFPSSSMLTWRVLLNRVPTKDNLHSRVVQLINRL